MYVSLYERWETPIISTKFYILTPLNTCVCVCVCKPQQNGLKSQAALIQHFTHIHTNMHTHMIAWAWPKIKCGKTHWTGSTTSNRSSFLANQLSANALEKRRNSSSNPRRLSLQASIRRWVWSETFGQLRICGQNQLLESGAADNNKKRVNAVAVAKSGKNHASVKWKKQKKNYEIKQRI